MKYYIYISDTKVDMLLPQVPHDIKKKVATEFGIDLKLLTAKRKVESESENNQISRLETVVEFIREYGNLGTVDQPAEYVEGDLPMFWGPYGGTPVVYFGGETEETVIGLGGSLKHIVGTGDGGDSYPVSGSMMPPIMSYLFKELDLGENPGYEHPALTVFDGVDIATAKMEGTAQKVEFIAKRLAYGKPTYRPRRKYALLATPLYVALSE